METQKKVLIIEIIEDEASQQKALTEKFMREGFRVISARDGEEGMRIALKEHPDIILLDIVMPKVDGLSLLKKLRGESSWGKTVPVILLTNLSADNDKIISIIAECEPAYYLVKADFTLDQVVEKVRERLAKTA
jgi:two-component system response regulator MprA